MRIFFIIASVCVWVWTYAPLRAETPPQPYNPALLNIARQFADRVSTKFNEADRAMGLASQNGIALPEGETLLFNIALPKDVVLENIVTAEVHNHGFVLSLRDFIASLEFPIAIENNNADGWYIRQAKMFHLDGTARKVKTDHGEFAFSDAVLLHDDDIWVPVNELAHWFGFELNAETSELKLTLTSPTPLPIEERLARKQRKFADRRLLPAELPYHAEAPQALAYPFVDVATQSTYSKNGQTGKSDIRRDATVTTTGDFAYGTLSTQTQLNDDDYVSAVRATYKKEGLDPELLGALHARKYEIGTINQPSQPLTDTPPAGLGMHITNVNPLRTGIDATTDIAGYASPGWDAELYRDNQLLDTQTVGDDGRYDFRRIDLFSNDNNFRVVLYGPQGEVREEKVYIPIDAERMANSGSAYDIALTADDTQIYQKEDSTDEDHGAPRLNAQYEVPFGQESALQLGFEAGQQDGDAEAVAHGGLSTTLAQTLLNLDTAVDESGEAAAELAARRNFGKHAVRNTVAWSTDRFGETASNNNTKTFGDRFSINGPFPLGIGNNPRYNFNIDYATDNSDDATTQGRAGFSTAFGRLTFNQQFAYTYSDTDTWDSITALSGTIDKNRLRLTSNYAMKPTAALENIRAELQRPLGRTTDIDVSLNRDLQANRTEGNAQLNWQTGFALVSPGVTYNSDGDVTIALNTRFGLAHDPQQGGIRAYDQPVTLNGGLSVFVYLDKNGNGEHDAGEQPIPNATIAAPQNGGRRQTGDDGYAFFNSMQKLRLTDVYLERDSLEDPYWVPATKGVSVLPREGHVTELQFPVVQGGEMDGTVSARYPDGQLQPLQNIPVTLYTADGARVMDTVSGPDGYYVFSPIPPGNYMMVAGSPDIKTNLWGRPEPTPVTIGYDGTIITANDVYFTQGSDVPIRVLANADGIIHDDPALDKQSLDGTTVVLNLGTYHSRLMMAVMWFKTRSFFGNVVADLKTLVAPQDSYAATTSGEHTLRISSPALTLEDGYRRCALISAGGIPCTLEILPGGLKTAGL